MRKGVHKVVGAVVVGDGVVGKTNTSVLALPRKMHLGRYEDGGHGGRVDHDETLAVGILQDCQSQTEWQGQFEVQTLNRIKENVMNYSLSMKGGEVTVKW